MSTSVKQRNANVNMNVGNVEHLCFLIVSMWICIALRLRTNQVKTKLPQWFQSEFEFNFIQS
jgi:hypothetical protein